MIRNVQIIVFALAMGPIVFAGIALFQRMNHAPQQQAVTAWLAVGFAVTVLGVRSFIGATTVSKQRQRIAAGSWSLGPVAAPGGLPANMTDGDRLLFAFQQKTIIESALVEGATFFVLISFLVEGQWWSLALAGVLVALNVIPFPTYERVENWVRHQLELLELEKR
jgi:hypothetical protein